MTGSDGHRWFFDSGSTALAFAYSGDFDYGVPQWESLHEPDDLDNWLAGRFGQPATPTDAAVFGRALMLRSAISAVARAIADGQIPGSPDVDVINESADRPAHVPRLSGGTLPAPPPTTERMIATIAQDAIRTLSAAPGRLRRCPADDCGLIFLDTSRPGNRRWCSMSRCGGRAKARAHYKRQKEDD
jgi:predicted RNA-binding Zn ribbon-like protein